VEKTIFPGSSGPSPLIGRGIEALRVLREWYRATDGGRNDGRPSAMADRCERLEISLPSST